ncbi:MAG: hypothetical protein JSV53_06845 [candidate division WOR-3 bacterium]|nr:MAG: hypothetical protein JSV53_06845 [candidate division WOR-3 bacterium]
MKKILRIANILAIFGTAWMAIIIIMIRVSPEFVRSFGSRGPMLTVLAMTEIVFAFSLLFFFTLLHVHNVNNNSTITSFNATLSALIAMSWMSVIAVLHRFPAVWRWVATRGSGLIVSLTQVIFTIPLLLFFILFSMASNRRNTTLRLRVASTVAVTGTAWLLLVSASRVSPAVWMWLIEKGAGRVMIITEPLVAISFLIFLAAFFVEHDVQSTG